MVQQKDTAIAKQQRRAMAQLLEVRRLLKPILHYRKLTEYSKAKMNLHVSVSRTSFAQISIPNSLKY